VQKKKPDLDRGQPDLALVGRPTDSRIRFPFSD